MRLGNKQLEMLKMLGTSFVLIVPSKRSRRLVQLGLCRSNPDGSFCRITPAGLRALADAADAGRITLFDTGAFKERVAVKA